MSKINSNIKDDFQEQGWKLYKGNDFVQVGEIF